MAVKAHPRHPNRVLAVRSKIARLPLWEKARRFPFRSRPCPHSRRAASECRAIRKLAAGQVYGLATKRQVIAIRPGNCSNGAHD